MLQLQLHVCFSLISVSISKTKTKTSIVRTGDFILFWIVFEMLWFYFESFSKIAPPSFGGLGCLRGGNDDRKWICDEIWLGAQISKCLIFVEKFLKRTSFQNVIWKWMNDEWLMNINEWSWFMDDNMNYYDDNMNYYVY